MFTQPYFGTQCLGNQSFANQNAFPVNYGMNPIFAGQGVNPFINPVFGQSLTPYQQVPFRSIGQLPVQQALPVSPYAQYAFGQQAILPQPILGQGILPQFGLGIQPFAQTWSPYNVLPNFIEPRQIWWNSPLLAQYPNINSVQPLPFISQPQVANMQQAMPFVQQHPTSTVSPSIH